MAKAIWDASATVELLKSDGEHPARRPATAARPAAREKAAPAPADSLPSDVAACCKLLHTPASEQNLLQTVHKLLHSVAPRLELAHFTLASGGRHHGLFNTLRLFSTDFDMIDNFRLFSTLGSLHNASKGGSAAQNIGSGT